MDKGMATRVGLAALLLVFLSFFVALLVNADHHLPLMARQYVAQADPKRGPAAIEQYGCGTCHSIQGVNGADGKVGPALTGLSGRSLLAGMLPNTPENMIQWIQHPQEMHPGTDMPDMGVTDQDARDIAAYLYSLP